MLEPANPQNAKAGRNQIRSCIDCRRMYVAAKPPSCRYKPTSSQSFGWQPDQYDAVTIYVTRQHKNLNAFFRAVDNVENNNGYSVEHYMWTLTEVIILEVLHSVSNCRAFAWDSFAECTPSEGLYDNSLVLLRITSVTLNSDVLCAKKHTRRLQLSTSEHICKSEQNVHV